MIGACGGPVHARGMCGRHYTRWRRHGDAGPADLQRRPNGTGRVHAAGYVYLTLPGHVLADRNGGVLRHRVVLFDKIGPGPHCCHWCGAHVNWRPGPPGGCALTVDHLDHQPGNDDPDNLVPACHPCNSRRHRTKGTKLDSTKVRAIRRCYTGQTGHDFAAIGREYGISDVMARKVVLGLAWLDVDG